MPATGPDIHTHEDVIPLQKLLFRQTLTPIENGDKKIGFLLFVLDDSNLTIPYLARKGTKFVLSCTDTDGNTVTETHTLTGTNAGYQHDVGLEK
jgi:hypothetical protein